MKTSMIGYRFFALRDSKLVSTNGTFVWPRPNGYPGNWVCHKGSIKLCATGLHASPTVLDALKNRQGTEFGMVSASGIEERDESKFVARRMRIERLWSSRYLVALGGLAAIKSLPKFERKYPDDNRPRTAVMAVLGYLDNRIISDFVVSDAFSAAHDAYLAAPNPFSAATPLIFHAAYAATRSAAVARVISAATHAAYAAYAVAYAARAALVAFDSSSAHDHTLASDVSFAAYDVTTRKENFNKHAVDILSLEESQLAKYLRRVLEPKRRKS